MRIVLPAVTALAITAFAVIAFVRGAEGAEGDRTWARASPGAEDPMAMDHR
jgi:hypothetical protein